jgi:hypothetical protein
MNKKVVAVKHQNNHNVYYFFTDMEDLKVGDTVVVDTRYGFQIGEVVSFVEYTPPVNVTKWVVDKVNVEAHNRRLEREKKLNEIRKKLDARRKQLEEMAVYSLLAQGDAEMARLLKEYKEVSD